jgi:CRISPR-associated endonuclease/helicase Cas3
LPTTGTSTEHFKDYALESGIDASLTHSRASVDLTTIAGTTAEEETTAHNENAAEAARSSLEAMRDKIESLALWGTPLVVTTTDTVLGLMANGRKSIYSLPAIMNSIIVFDEIHAFDDQLFGHLLVFLKNFPNLPVLLMTASLPQDRKLVLQQIRPDLACITGPPEFELLKRYEIKYEANHYQILDSIEHCLKTQGKVLWVRNRVDWANSSYRDCLDRFGQAADVDVYHSRFRYKDRAHRHRRVIDRFRNGKRGCILVATQVAEMSLDLSADLLITDLAPIPALIQRMGRLNRYSTPDSPGVPKHALVEPLPAPFKINAKPYEPDELEQAKTWLRRLEAGNTALCQRDLSEMFAEVSEAKEIDFAEAERQAIFFSGLWQTRPGLTREQGYTMSVILQQDLDLCTDWDSWGEPTKDWLKRYEVSIPIKETMLRWHRVAYLPIAPQDAVSYDYDEKTMEGTGASWL